MPEQLLTPAQVAEYLQVPLGTVYAWSSRGGGPRFTKIGRHLRVRPQDLDAYVDEQQRPRTVGRP